MLTINKAVFTTSAKDVAGSPRNAFPEIAFAGKSNVGKSSLINYLTNNSKLAYVSKQPGKTRLINYFAINDALYFVDLPGYGFARVSKAQKEQWAHMMESYFAESEKLLALIVLVDMRHDPTADDLQMMHWADFFDIPFAVVATKADKIAKSKRYNYARSLERMIEEKIQPTSMPKIISASSTAKIGKSDILSYIAQKLEEGYE